MSKYTEQEYKSEANEFFNESSNNSQNHSSDQSVNSFSGAPSGDPQNDSMEIREATQRLDQLSAEAMEIKAILVEKTNQKNQLQRECGRIYTAYKKIKHEALIRFKQRDESISQLSKNLSEKESQIAKYEQQIKNLLQESNAYKTKLEARLRTIAQELQESKTRCTEKDATLTQYLGELNKLRATVSMFSKADPGKHHELSKRDEFISQLQAKLVHASAELQSVRTEKDKIRSESDVYLHMLRQELDSTKAHAVQMESTLTHYRNEVDRLEHLNQSMMKLLSVDQGSQSGENGRSQGNTASIQLSLGEGRGIEN